MTGSKTELSLREVEMVQTRVMHAPRELVWRVWTEPEHLARWFGPRVVTITQRFDTNADRDANVRLGATAGWNDSFEKMDELLAVL